MCVCVSVCLCICASVRLCISVSVRLCVCASVHLCVCASMCLCVSVSGYHGPHGIGLPNKCRALPVRCQGEIAEAGVGRQLPDGELDEEVAVEPQVRQVLQPLEGVLVDEDELEEIVSHGFESI